MFVKNRIFQLVIGFLALVLAVFSALMLGNVVPSKLGLWAHAVIFICLFVNIIEVIIYFLFAKTETTRIFCRWLNLFTICVMFVALTAGFVQAAPGIFAEFSVNDALDFFLILANYVLISIVIVFLVFSKKEAQLKKQNK